jgi:hypothetical protein
MKRARSVRPFTPGKEPAAALASRTVGRANILDLLDRRLLAVATSRNRPHTLLVGPRGAGKTHLVEVALHHAGKRAEFRDRVRVVRLDEDIVGISRYRDVLREVLSRLPIDGGAPREARPVDPEAAIARALGSRALVLVIENLDRLFQSLGTSGQQDLRAWVENSRSVMLLATAPLLFPGVQDRNQPWYGNLGITHLEELDVEDGAQLLTHIARERGDEDLAAFLQTDRGFARLRAINHLAGGSPRIWMILSDCISVELLDELTPAVEALMEGLVPYYQQLLWDLSANEQRLVRALADGSVQAMTVTMLAEATDIEQRSAATSLGRLERARWVRAEKPSGLDQRTTWYRLREPLLRHHLHYRSAIDQPLPLIVDLLRAWFEPRERRSYLLQAEPGSSAEMLLASSLSLEPHRFDAAYADRDVDALLLDARRWITGGDAHSRTPEAGSLIEFSVLLAQDKPALARASLEARVRAGAADDLLAIIDDVKLAEGENEADRVGIALAVLAQRASGRTRHVLELVSACWDGSGNPAKARDRLIQLDAALAEVSHSDVLALDVREELAFWTVKAGEPTSGRDQLSALLPDRIRVLGPDHPDTLSTRHNLADFVGDAGDPVAARDEFSALLPDHIRVLGTDHPDTLSTRHNLAYWTGQAGDPAAARDHFSALLPDRTRVLGTDHPDTLTTRHSLAYWTGQAGDPAAARDQLTALLPDRTRVFGAESVIVIRTQLETLAWTSRAGRPAEAAQRLIALGRTDRVSSETPLRIAVEHAVGEVLMAFLDRASQDQDDPINDQLPAAALLTDLRAAVTGDLEALARIPAELVPIITEVREREHNRQGSGS